MGIIYMIRNKGNNKRYIGKTKQHPSERFRQHLESARIKGKRAYDTCLSRGIRKWGRDFFEIGIIASNINDNMLDIVEEHYIDMYNTVAPNGYNKSRGGNDNSIGADLDNLAPDDDYSDHPQVIIDEISDEDVRRFLEE